MSESQLQQMRDMIEETMSSMEHFNRTGQAADPTYIQRMMEKATRLVECLDA